MSANSSEISISAPPGPCFASAPMHALHSCGFFSHGPNHGLSTNPPMPPNGAWHILQRGGDGIRRKLRRSASALGLSGASIARHSSSFVGGVTPGV